MFRNFLNKLCGALMLAALFGTVPAVAQEGLYIEGPELTPGDATAKLLTISFENAAYEDYCAFQFDIELPNGLELAYDKRGRARVALNTGDDSYIDDHTLASDVQNNLIKLRCFSASNSSFWGNGGALIDIYVVPTAYLKPGDVTIKLHDVKFARVVNEYGFRADELTLTGITAKATSTLPVKVSATNKFSTAVFPFDVDAIPAGLEVYSCNSTDGESLVLTKQSKAAAYTPYILFAENGFSGTLSGAVNANKYSEVVSDGYLCGAVAAQEIDGGNGYYVMQNKGDGPMFYKVSDTSFSIPAGKCWLALPAALQGSASFRLDGTTGISEVKGENGEVKAIYDLQGRRVDNPTKGIYIIDGKKTFVK